MIIQSLNKCMVYIKYTVRFAVSEALGIRCGVAGCVENWQRLRDFECNALYIFSFFEYTSILEQVLLISEVVF